MHTPSPPDDASTALSPQQRLAAYWNALKEQRARKSVREVLEREVLHCVIATNRDRIDEYPLLTPQRQTIIDFLGVRGAADPLHPLLATPMALFFNLLSRYGSCLEAEDAAGAEREAPALLNQEALLLKMIQGTVYATALTVDNFSEVLIRHYGEEALGPIDHIMEEVELGERFWKEHFEHFISTLADRAYREITANQQYTVRRDRSQIVIRFDFDDILARLKRTDKTVEKTRAQTAYAQSGTDTQARAAHERFTQYMLQLAQQPGYFFSASDLPHVARIVCMDPVSAALPEALHRLNRPAPDQPVAEEMSGAQARFVVEQATLMACAAAISLHLMRADFQKSLSSFESREAALIMKQLGVFSLAGIGQAFFSMLEFQFIAIIRQRAGDDIGKMQIRSTRLRRVGENAIAPLDALGLNRIHRNKLWVRDPDNSSQLLFAQQNLTQLTKLVDIMQLSPQLQQALLVLWRQAEYKITLAIHLNLDLLSRTTTNLNQRLGEIFLRFGTLGPGQGSKPRNAHHPAPQ